MLKRNRYFSISIPIVGLIMSIVCRLILGVDAVETSVNLYGFSMGIIVLCLTQFFIHGAELEKDVDGLFVRRRTDGKNNFEIRPYDGRTKNVIK